MYLTRTPLPNLGGNDVHCQCGALKTASNDRCVACQATVLVNNERAKHNGLLSYAGHAQNSYLHHASHTPSQIPSTDQSIWTKFKLWLKKDDEQSQKVRQLVEGLHLPGADSATDGFSHTNRNSERQKLITEVSEAEDDRSKSLKKAYSMEVFDTKEPRPISKQHDIQQLFQEFEDDYTIVGQNLRLRGPENMRPNGSKRLEDLLRRLPITSSSRSEETSLLADVSFDERIEEQCPYIPQNVIDLKVEEITADTGYRTVQATIIKVFTPFSLSCTMVVQPHEPIRGYQGQMVLKLFDRRFARGARKHYLEEEEIDWSPDMGRKYVQAVRDGTAQKLARKFYSGFNDVITTSNLLEEDEVPDWTDVHSEVQMWLGLTGWCLDEAEAYERLKDLQGHGIPRFISRVVKFTCPHMNSSCHPLGTFLDVQGILIEYFPQSFNLRKIKKYAPREHWKAIIDQATHLASLLFDRGVCNRDACPRNTLVYYEPQSDKFRTVMIDFGWSSFRRSENDIEWNSLKAQHDEEDNIGRATLLLYFRDEGWEYVRSETMDRLALEYQSGCNDYDEHSVEHADSDNCDKGCSISTCTRFNAYWARYLVRFYERWAEHKSKGCGLCQKPFDPCSEFRREQELDNRRKFEAKKKLRELLSDSSEGDKGLARSDDITASSLASE